jgi:hypothetical protein
VFWGESTNRFVMRCLVAAGALSASVLAPASASAAVPLSARVSAQGVTVGRSLVVTGTAAPGSRVSLDWRRAGTWQHLATRVADAAGAYRFTAPTWWLGTRDLRVSDDGASALLAYGVHPAYRPTGNAGDYRRYLGQKYWDPCKPITWVFNPTGGYAGSLRTITEAVRRVSEATGIRFVYKGRTGAVAFRDAVRSTGAKLLISWATPRQVPALAGTVVGSAGTTTGWSGYYDRGQVVLDRTQHLRPGFHASGSYDWGQVMLHELGHVMGLDHVTARSAIMYRETSYGAHRYSAGDLAGLRAVGAQRRCA